MALARVYLLKAPGMTAAKVERGAAGRRWRTLGQAFTAISADDLKLRDLRRRRAHTARQITRSDKLEWYIGRKSINRLGCYGCHDVPGFETAKPVGTALNDWGKKDPERLAFEDADAYVREHHNIVEARDAADNPHQAGRGLAHGGRQDRPTRSCFYDALAHHDREGFLHEKLDEPRSYDYNRIRAWDDRLRMPQFRFARTRPAGRRGGRSV